MHILNNSSIFPPAVSNIIWHSRLKTCESVGDFSRTRPSLIMRSREQFQEWQHRTILTKAATLLRIMRLITNKYKRWPREQAGSFSAWWVRLYQRIILLHSIRHAAELCGLLVRLNGYRVMTWQLACILAFFSLGARVTDQRMHHIRWLNTNLILYTHSELLLFRHYGKTCSA